jgi:N-acetylmuramoyl-L-alanine amidase
MRSLDGLLEHLAARDIRVDVDQWLRLHVVLERGDDWTIERFSNVLASVLATSPEEIVEIREAVALWRSQQEAQETEQNQRKRVPRYSALLTAAVALLIVGQLYDRRPKRAVVPEPVRMLAPDTPSPEPPPIRQVPEESADDGEVMPSCAPEISAPASVEPRPSERVIRLPKLVARSVPLSLAISFLLCLLAPLTLFIALLMWRRQVKEEGGDIEVAAGPTAFWLPFKQRLAPRILERTERDELTSGLQRFEISERSNRLDVRPTIDATIDQAGAPQMRFKPRANRRRVRILHDLASEGTAAARLVREVVAELEAAGIEVGVSTFWSVPLKLENDGAYASAIDLLTEEASGDVVAFVTDGRGLLTRWERTGADGRITITGLLRRLALWERAAFFDVGSTADQRALKSLLSSFELRCFSSTLLSRFVSSEGTLDADAAEPRVGPVWLWAACCAVYPLSVPDSEALLLRERLNLPVSAHALSLLQARSTDPQGIRFSPEHRAMLIDRMRSAFQNDEGESVPPVLRKAVDHWRQRIADQEDWRSDTTGRGLHRRLLMALLDLWTDPSAAATELSRLRRTPHFGRAQSELRNFKTQDAAGHGIELPFSFEGLDPEAKRRFDALGLGSETRSRARQRVILAVLGTIAMLAILGAIGLHRARPVVSVAEPNRAELAWAIEASSEQRVAAMNKVGTNIEGAWSKLASGASDPWLGLLPSASRLPVVKVFAAGDWISLGAFAPESDIAAEPGGWLAATSQQVAGWLSGAEPYRGFSDAGEWLERRVPCVARLPSGGEVRRCGFKADVMRVYGPRIAVLDAEPSDIEAGKLADTLLDRGLVDTVWLGDWPSWSTDQDLSELPNANALGVVVFTKRSKFLEGGRDLVTGPIGQHCWIRSNAWTTLRAGLDPYLGDDPFRAMWPTLGCHGEGSGLGAPRNLVTYEKEVWPVAQRIAEQLRRAGGFRVESRQLVGPNGARVPFHSSPNVGDELTSPSFLVLHYTGSSCPSIDSSIQWLTKPNAKASEHLLIDRDGRIAQLVPFDRVAWHAGPSSWDGISGLNKASLSISLNNAGPLTEAGDVYRSRLGKAIPISDVVIVGSGENARAWQAFTPLQLGTLIAVAEAVVSSSAGSSIREILGHDQISPKRKVDPGPALAIDQLRQTTKLKELLAARKNQQAPQISTSPIPEQDLRAQTGQRGSVTRLPIDFGGSEDPSSVRVVAGEGRTVPAGANGMVLEQPPGTSVLSSAASEDGEVLTEVRTGLPWMVVDVDDPTASPRTVRTARPFLMLAQPIRWNAATQRYEAELLVGLDSEEGSSSGPLEEPLRTNLSVTCDEVTPSTVTLGAIGPKGDQLIRVYCSARAGATRRHELTVRMASGQLSYPFELPANPGAYVLTSSTTSIAGLGLSTVRLTISQVLEDGSPLVLHTDVEIPLSSDSAVLDPRTATIRRGYSDTSLDVTLFGLGATQIRAGVEARASLPIEISREWPLLFTLVTALGGALGALVAGLRARRPRTRLLLRSRRAIEGALIGVVGVGAVLATPGFGDTLPIASRTSELGWLLSAALAGFVGAELIDLLSRSWMPSKRGPTPDRPDG